MPKFISLVGQVFGRLQIIERVKMPHKKHVYWRCSCECGNETIARGDSLKVGRIVSCGCYNKEKGYKHGACVQNKKTKTYKIWSGMIDRCYNKNHKYYKDYGGRGIWVYERWRGSYQNFLDDMGDVPEGKTLERVNNNSGYNPDNCKWASRKEQLNNRRNNIVLLYNGQSRTKAQWEDVLNFPKGLLTKRINELGWDICKALTTKVGSSDFRSKRKNASSSFYGVSYSKRDNKFHALVYVNKKRLTLGYFDKEKDAAMAYNKYVIKHKLNKNLNVGFLENKYGK